jgi:hypothetical protein
MKVPMKVPAEYTEFIVSIEGERSVDPVTSIMRVVKTDASKS